MLPTASQDFPAACSPAVCIPSPIPAMLELCSPHQKTVELTSLDFCQVFLALPLQEDISEI